MAGRIMIVADLANPLRVPELTRPFRNEHATSSANMPIAAHNDTRKHPAIA
jgi:hypothetical protein